MLLVESIMGGIKMSVSCFLSKALSNLLPVLPNTAKIKALVLLEQEVSV